MGLVHVFVLKIFHILIVLVHKYLHLDSNIVIDDNVGGEYFILTVKYYRSLTSSADELGYSISGALHHLRTANKNATHWSSYSRGHQRLTRGMPRGF